MTKNSPHGHGHSLGTSLNLEIQVQDTRHSYNGRIIGHHIWSVKWNEYQLSWVSTKISFVSETFLVPITPEIQHV